MNSTEPRSPRTIRSIGGLMHAVRNILQKKTKQALRKLKISPLEGFELIYVVESEKDGGVSQSVICELLSVTAPAVVKMTQEMEQMGLIYRQENPEDRRSQLLFATEEGKRVYAEFQKIVDAEEEKMLSACTEEERRELTRILLKLIEYGS